MAQRANHEDEETVRSFQARYRAARLVDEASLLACAAYVDLNPIRAAMAETLEASDHISVQRRIGELANRGAPTDPLQPRADCDSFLSQLMIEEQLVSTGPCPSQAGTLCSDKGFLAMLIEDYLELLDWFTRQLASGKRGYTPDSIPPVLSRLGLDSRIWCELVSDFGKLFCILAGRPEQVDAMRSHRTHRRYHLRRARELFASS